VLQTAPYISKQPGRTGETPGAAQARDEAMLMKCLVRLDEPGEVSNDADLIMRHGCSKYYPESSFAQPNHFGFT
jgi:hypothetical protein